MGDMTEFKNFVGKRALCASIVGAMMLQDAMKVDVLIAHIAIAHQQHRDAVGAALADLISNDIVTISDRDMRVRFTKKAQLHVLANRGD